MWPHLQKITVGGDPIVSRVRTSVLAFASALLVLLGGCAWRQGDPDGESRTILEEHVDGKVDGVVGSYISYGVPDWGNYGTLPPVREEGGEILIFPMRSFDELLGIARRCVDDWDDRYSVAIPERLGGGVFSLDDLDFSRIDGRSSDVEDGYFEISGVSSGRYLVCHAARIQGVRLGYWVRGCARDIEIDPPSALDARLVNGAFWAEVTSLPEGAG